MQKKEYRRPQLAEYGRLESLTLGIGHCPFGNEDHPSRASIFLAWDGAHGHRGCSLGLGS